MEYGIRELSRLAGVSTRTLRYYDEIGLLKPDRVTEGGYRCYGAEKVMLLQQILFYRQRGFELKTIQKILYEKDFDMLRAMEDHLRALEDRKMQTEALIRTVQQTIRHLKGEEPMSDKEKFRAWKQNLLEENEKNHGAEARQKYGAEQVDAANRHMMNLTEEQFARWQTLDAEIIARLESAVRSCTGADNDEGKAISELHRQWLMLANPKYSPQMHRGIAMMYVTDERFTRYYDRNVEGCARLLCDAVLRWI